MRFLSLGGADEVGGSCYYYNFNGTGIVIDAGIFPSKKGKDVIPDFSPLDNLPTDAVIITHAHQDHIGALPFLIRKFPHLKIYTTLQTAEIAALTLHNSAKLLKKQFSSDGEIKPYTHDEINLLVRSIQFFHYGEEFKVDSITSLSPPVDIRFYDAGHILGAAGVLMESSGEKVFHTGDIKLKEQYVLSGADLTGLKTDTLVLESTYGGENPDDIPTWRDEIKRLAKALNKVLLDGGSVMIPVFSLGKTQEILAIIGGLLEKGKIIESRIYTMGLGRPLSALYDKNRYLVKRNLENLEIRKIPQYNLGFVRDLTKFRKKPGIVLAPGGMMVPGTVAHRLIPYWLNQKEFAIFTVGYMEETTPGYIIQNAKRGDKIKIEKHEGKFEVKCDIQNFRFTSHADRNDLLRIVQQVNPKNVILIHGEEYSIGELGKEILTRYPHIKLYASEVGKFIEVGG